MRTCTDFAHGTLLLALAVLLPVMAAAGSSKSLVLVTIDGLAAYYLSDPHASMPALRKLIAEGAVAESLRVSNPSTTWPNHTSLVTGVHPDVHSVLFNGMLVRGGAGEPVRVEPESNQSELIAAPTVYDRLHQAGYRTAAINWPCTRGTTTLDDNFPDAPDPIRSTTPRLRAELIRDRILDDSGDATFLKKGAVAADQAWTAAALHVLQARPPALLLLHLLDTDVIQHRYGPRSEAAYAALALADARIADLLRALNSGPLRGQTTVFVVSDHGFTKPLKLINPNVVLRKAGLLRPAPRRRAQCISQGGTAFVFLTNPSTAAADKVRVIDLLGALEGIARIVEPNQYPALHLPDPRKHPQMGDLLLVATEGYTFSDEFLDDDTVIAIPMSLGSHGYLSTNPEMNGVFIAWGRGIAPGIKLPGVDVTDVAPTIAAFFGEELPGATGRVIKEIIPTPTRTEPQERGMK